MNVFEATKQSVTTRQAAEHYGIHVNRGGMCVCPFHNDKNPSMKVDRRFYCFGCGATGDVIDLVSRLHGIGSKKAALMLAQDFSIPYEDKKNAARPSVRARLRRETEEQKFKRLERHCFRVLSDYYHLLRRWREEYAPREPDEAWHPRFAEALQNIARLEHLMDVLLSGDIRERATLITDCGKEVKSLEKRMAELAAPVATCLVHIHHFSSLFLGLHCFPCSKSWSITRFSLSSTLWVLVSEKCTSTK